GAAGGCKVEPDAAPAALPAVAVAVVVLLLPVTPSLPSEKRYDLEVTQRGLSHQYCKTRKFHSTLV
ncbi:hypothetical protein A2U01_0103406, partial [Trifolium medium]|nr:hypothetical protein [Trifolium medium]